MAKGLVDTDQCSLEQRGLSVVVMANVRGRDLAGFIAEACGKIEREMKLTPGYYVQYGAIFEQFTSASKRLSVLMPLAIVLIFGLLLMTFGAIKDAALVFCGAPRALTGGELVLLLPRIPLSITVSVGFIILYGVAVLIDVVMVSVIGHLLRDGASLDQAIACGAVLRLRPVLMIGSVASLGFLPMGLNTGTCAEVQRPLATVVIGGVISATLLTLLVLPALFWLAHSGTVHLPKIEPPRVTGE